MTGVFVINSIAVSSPVYEPLPPLPAIPAARW